MRAASRLVSTLVWGAQGRHKRISVFASQCFLFPPIVMDEVGQRFTVLPASFF